MAIQIDAEFSQLIPPLSEDEYRQLEANMLRDGCREPLVTWGGILVDGHNRHRICEAHGIGYQTLEMPFADREAVADWIDANQLGRRNLKPDQMTMLRGRRYNRTKKAQGGTGANQHEQSGQNVHSAKTAEKLAAQYGVSEKTIRRDGQFAAAVEALADVAPDLERRIIAADDPPTRAAIIEAAALVGSEPERAREIVARGEAEILKAAREIRKTHRTQATGEVEWYTPPAYIEKARRVLGGGIDLDPASSEIANRAVMAREFYTVEDNGIGQEWAGRVWLNPPYMQPDVRLFVEKMCAEYESGNVTAAVMLTNNSTETAWFQWAARRASAMCFPASRISFLKPTGDPWGSPLQGQCFFYFGPDVAVFAEHFAEIGVVVARVGEVAK